MAGFVEIYFSSNKGSYQSSRKDRLDRLVEEKVQVNVCVKNHYQTCIEIRSRTSFSCFELIPTAYVINV